MIFQNHYITGPSSAQDFLHSIGMDDFDVEEFISLLCSEYEDDKRYWMAEAESWKVEAEMEYEKRNDLITDLWNVVDDLIKGKGTKKQIADKISNLCEYWS